MKLGAFLVPSRPPERSRSDNRCWELEELVRLEELGLDEAWIGEQIATSWGTCDLPELIIARSLFETNRIRLGTLGYLLPHNNPIEMANRIAYLDHVSNGRIQLGIGVRSLPADNIIAEAEVGRSSRLSFELIETMVDLWQTEAPKIEYGRGSMEATGISLPWLGRDCKPLQQPHPPIAIAAITPSSRNLRFAGEKGYIPISLSVDPDGSCTALHWRTVQKGAERSGLSPDPEAWRIVRDIYVAPTDAEARDCAVNGIMGRCWREFILPAYLEMGLGATLKRDRSMPDDAIDIDYLVENVWLVGSPETVTERLFDLYIRSGGFGYLLAASYNAQDEEQTWERSLRLLSQEVLPACNRLIKKSKNCLASEDVR